jgi:glycosyltransferase involved in cell wall biosynthesis
MKRKVLVLGYFGYQTNQIDGQTIKTRNIYELLHSNEQEFQYLKYFDTQLFKRNKFYFINLLLKIIKCNVIVYIPAHNNLKFIFPIIFIISRIKKIDILYFVVGGWLAEFLKTKKILTIFLSKIEGIFVETNQLKNLLIREFSFNNVTIFPNFRIHKYIPFFKEINRPFGIVFIARINRLKGLDTIFNLAEYILDSKQLRDSIIIDFYGPIDKNDKIYFEENVNKYFFVSYKGVLPPDRIYEVLNNYDISVLPTKYFTEGLPGSVIDSYIAGIPVIASEWKYANEFIINEDTGFIIPFQKGENDFINSILKLYYNRELLYKMKIKAYEKSKSYSSDKAWKIIKCRILNIKQVIALNIVLMIMLK